MFREIRESREKYELRKLLEEREERKRREHIRKLGEGSTLTIEEAKAEVEAFWRKEFGF